MITETVPLIFRPLVGFLKVEWDGGRLVVQDYNGKELVKSSDRSDGNDVECRRCRVCT